MDVTIKYMNGTDNAGADYLPRSPELDIADQNGEDNGSATVNNISITSIKKMILSHQTNAKLNEKAQQSAKTIDGLTYVNGGIWIPSSFATDWVYHYHKKLCHIGVNKLYDTINRYHYVENLHKICRQVVGQCINCKMNKFYSSQRVKHLANERAMNVYERIYMDIMYVEKKGVTTSMLTITDSFSGYIMLFQ